MSNNKNQTGESAELRYRAEKALKLRATEVPGSGSAAQTQRLVHELQVHQIELDMQSDELRESRSHVETALARFTDLYDFAPVGYFTFSVDGTIREVNLPGARLLGFERSRVIGGRFQAHVSESTRPVFDSWLKQVFATRVKQTCIVNLAREAGSQSAVEIEATLSTDGLEARTVVVDITARKVLEEQLRQAQKMEVIGQLAGGVAHEFNNIVAAMLLNLEMLELQHELPAGTQSSLHDLETLAKRAAGLTQKLTLFSRLQAMQPVHLEINGALRNLLKTLERLLPQNITCLQLPSTQEAWVDADPSMLDQAVMNLCLNARDAMSNGGTLTVETSLAEFTVESAHIQPEARAGKFVCLRISDSGCGIEADVLRHLFEPFFTTKEIGQGSGLGLAAAYGVVRQHEGWMNVESVVGRGTTFRLYLPLSMKKEAAPARTSQTSSFKGKNETILLVEDEVALLFVGTRALTRLGYRVLSANNGQEALELWKQHQDDIDLVLTDMRMPQGLTGLELAEKLWKAKPSLKIIIMSGYSMETAQNRTADNAGYTFLSKPFGLKTLAETVRHCLD